MNISANAQKVLESRYFRKDREGNLIETPDELFQRVARSVSQAELHFENTRQAAQWEDEFLAALTNLDFLPNSPTLMNAGLQQGQLSACYVLHVNDSMTSIFKTLQDAALIQQRGGGTGFNFSQLRPRGDYLSKGCTASGPVSFMKTYETVTNHIKQGGRRRGANMGILNADHPAIEQFIDVKAKEGGLTNFNLSVGVTDEFMHAVQNNDKWKLVHPSSGRVMQTVNAQRSWSKIIENAWSTGDPGLVLRDTINHSNPTPAIGRIICTNPCGEVPLLQYESCHLGSINLGQMVSHGADGAEVDWAKLKRLTRTGTRFLDDVLDVNHCLTQEMANAAKGNRKIGLGVMGRAEMLIQLGIPYDSQEALQKAEEVIKFIRYHSDETSKELTEARGSFPNWQWSTSYPDTPIRNATRISIAPTGSISIIANASSSIEPLFALAYNRRNVLENQKLTEINQLFC
jgi:ribonucleoside-diphosphate reductase alpha chain